MGQGSAENAKPGHTHSPGTFDPLGHIGIPLEGAMHHAVVPKVAICLVEDASLTACHKAGQGTSSDVRQASGWSEASCSVITCGDS
jgi:hypothetical protein